MELYPYLCYSGQSLLNSTIYLKVTGVLYAFYASCGYVKEYIIYSTRYKYLYLSI